MIRLKRAYEPASPSDGYRVFVERLWPRGLRKEDAHFDAWLKDVAPSDELRRWFHHDPERWSQFRLRYRKELRDAEGLLDDLAKRARRGRVTLVYATRDEEHNGAVVLRDVITSGSPGDGAAPAARRRPTPTRRRAAPRRR